MKNPVSTRTVPCALGYFLCAASVGAAAGDHPHCQRMDTEVQTHNFCVHKGTGSQYRDLSCDSVYALESW